MEDTINSAWFYTHFKPTGKKRSAIFGARKALMDELYATGTPIYCDQSYYVQMSNLHRVTKDGFHYSCDVYVKFEEWRDCHYYDEYADKGGGKVWLMTGGRYD